jgi:hypothetical protein
MLVWFGSPALSFLLMLGAGWVHRHQLIVIEFLQMENPLLKARLCGTRIRLTADSRHHVRDRGHFAHALYGVRSDEIDCQSAWGSRGAPF